VTKIEIVNIVATAVLGQPIDLSKLASFPQILYNPHKYRGMVAYFKTEKMRGKVSIFRTGKMISVGTKSEEQAKKALDFAQKFLLEIGLIKNVDLVVQVQNIVATADFEQPLNLEELPEKTRAIYEPEQFPGAILRIKEPFKTSVLLFASGKAVITGLKSQTEIEPTIKALKSILELNP